MVALIVTYMHYNIFYPEAVAHGLGCDSSKPNSVLHECLAEYLTDLGNTVSIKPNFLYNYKHGLKALRSYILKKPRLLLKLIALTPYLSLSYDLQKYNIIQIFKTFIEASFWCERYEPFQNEHIILHQPNIAELLACRLVGIVVYEIQHGDISIDVPYYRYLIKSNQHFAICILVWDLETLLYCENHLSATSPVRLKCISNPILYTYKKNKISSKFLRSIFKHSSVVSSKIQRPLEKSILLYAAQWGISKQYPELFQYGLPKLLLNFIRENSSRYKLLVRNHPVTSAFSRLDILEISQLNIDILMLPDDILLPHALSMADAFLTWQSSSVIESLHLGIKSILFTKLPYDYGPAFQTNEIPYSKYSCLFHLAYATESHQLKQLLI